MNKADPKTIVLQFNDYINNQDIDGLSSMMTDDHTLIAHGDAVPGKELSLGAWGRFFEACPDYINHFERLVSKGEFVAVIGHSTCSHEVLNGPALWAVKVKGDKVVEWNVMSDTPENRESLGIK